VRKFHQILALETKIGFLLFWNNSKLVNPNPDGAGLFFTPENMKYYPSFSAFRPKGLRGLVV